MSTNANAPLEVGTVAIHGAGGAMIHAPEIAQRTLWASAREDLNGDGSLELLHPRFGFADAFNLDIADAATRAGVSLDEIIRRIVAARRASLTNWIC